jgi:hypothetical protein
MALTTAMLPTPVASTARRFFQADAADRHGGVIRQALNMSGKLLEALRRGRHLFGLRRENVAQRDVRGRAASATSISISS